MPRRADRLDAGTAVLAAGAVLAAASVVATLWRGVPQPRVAVWFALLVFVGELLRVNLPGDRGAAPVGGAAAIGYSVLIWAGPGDPARHDALTVVAVVLAGMAAAAGLHLLVRRDPRPSDIARRLLTTVVVAVTFDLLVASPVGDVQRGRIAEHPILAMALAITVGVGAELVLGALVTTARQQAPFRASLRNEVTAALGLAAATAATGVLTAVAVPIMSGWALVVFSVPLLVTQFSFRRFASISATYRQTIRALARMSEVAGYVEDGHARRVMHLAVAVGREFGLTDAEMLDLEYAALMHDIGQLSLTEPIPRGSTLAVPPAERRRIAEYGADVIRSTGVLDRVAEIVEAQASPYRRMREAAAPDVPLASRIIKVASAYDDLVGASRRERGTRTAWDALERLRLEMAYEYDPAVVDALTRVLRRTGELVDDDADAA